MLGTNQETCQDPLEARNGHITTRKNKGNQYNGNRKRSTSQKKKNLGSTCLQVIFLPCYVVQANSSNENTDGSEKVDYEYELQELFRTPYWLKKLSHDEEA